MSAPVPAGKVVLNVHISKAEKEHVDQLAAAESMTITMVVREFIRRDMREKAKRVAEVAPEPVERAEDDGVLGGG